MNIRKISLMLFIIIIFSFNVMAEGIGELESVDDCRIIGYVYDNFSNSTSINVGLNFDDKISIEILADDNRSDLVNFNLIYPSETNHGFNFSIFSDNSLVEYLLNSNESLHNVSVNAILLDGSDFYLGKLEMNLSECDIDGDGFNGSDDNCPFLENTNQLDNDTDGYGDLCDDDDDGDGILDDGDLSGVIGDSSCNFTNTVNCDDNCQFVYNPNQRDSDGDGVGDLCDDNGDFDGVLDVNDNCPFVYNSDQLNTDNKTDNTILGYIDDLMGNACDDDDDNDGCKDEDDPDPLNINIIDTDNDGIGDDCDNCIDDSNTNQSDYDFDGEGDVCDRDFDGDFFQEGDEINEDCDDNNENINPHSIEIFNGHDDDCDGEIDEDFNWKQEGVDYYNPCNVTYDGTLSCPKNATVFQYIYNIGTDSELGDGLYSINYQEIKGDYIVNLTDINGNVIGTCETSCEIEINESHNKTRLKLSFFTKDGGIIDNVVFLKSEYYKGSYNSFYSGNDQRLFTDSSSSCCPKDFCFDGKNCVESTLYEQNVLKEPMFLSFGNDGYRCVKQRDENGNITEEAVWEFSKYKYDPYRLQSGYCPYDDMCFVTNQEEESDDPFGNRWTDSQRDAVFYGCTYDKNFVADSDISSKLKIGDFDERFYGENNLYNLNYVDFYCDKGNWTSRTKMLAQKMLEIGNRSGKSFALFCDKNPHEKYTQLEKNFEKMYGSVNNFYHPLASGEYSSKEGGHFLKGVMGLDNAGNRLEYLTSRLTNLYLFNNYCTLIIDTSNDGYPWNLDIDADNHNLTFDEIFSINDKVIIGTTLNRHLTEKLFIDNDKQYYVNDTINAMFGNSCMNSLGEENFSRCDDNIYYNDKIWGVIYSDNTDPSEFDEWLSGEKSIYSKIVGFFYNIFSTMLDDVSNNENNIRKFELFNEEMLFNKLYFSYIEEDSRPIGQVEAVVTRKMNAYNELKDYAYFKFTDFIENFCEDNIDANQRSVLIDNKAIKYYLNNESIYIDCKFNSSVNITSLTLEASNVELYEEGLTYKNPNPDFKIEKIFYDLTSRLRLRNVIDSDGDGWIDRLEECDFDPLKTEPGLCGCGKVDSLSDFDLDGVLDCNDICPKDPFKINDSGVCGCGVYELDFDGNGIVDEHDCICSIEYENKSGIFNKGSVEPVNPEQILDNYDNDDNYTCLDVCPDDPDNDIDGDYYCDGTMSSGVYLPYDPCPDSDMNDYDGDGYCEGTEYKNYSINNTFYYKNGSGDECAYDPLKTEPGVCGCGFLDIDLNKDGSVTYSPDCECLDETDSDGDETFDCADLCPDDPNKWNSENIGYCGCGVAETDSDSDGTPDCVDNCPTDPAKTKPGNCGCGVSDRDRDGDGTPDCIDSCPTDRYKTKPGICGCGVSDRNRDGDKRVDCQDICPTDGRIWGSAFSQRSKCCSSCGCRDSSNIYPYPDCSVKVISIGGSECFISDTKIEMGDGTYKNIQNIKIGDKVKGETGINTVLDLYHYVLGDQPLYSINGGEYFVTKPHPFKTTDGWAAIDVKAAKYWNPDLEIEKLEVGDILITDKGLEKVNSIRQKDSDYDRSIYNFATDGDQTYYADGYLVHNKGGPGKVLCTEANRQGYLSDELLKADLDYAKQNIDQVTMLGYHSWGKPLARLMAKDKKMAELIIPLSVEWAKHMAYLMNVIEKDSEVGKILTEVGLKHCMELGKVISNHGYESYEFDEEKVEKLVLKYFSEYSVENLEQNNGRERFDDSMNNLFLDLKELFYEKESRKLNFPEEFYGTVFSETVIG